MDYSKDYKLPCDVSLPGVTIRKGCTLETLMVGLRRRETPSPFAELLPDQKRTLAIQLVQLQKLFGGE